MQSLDKLVLGEYALPYLIGGEGRKTVFPGKYFQTSYMIEMIMCNQDPHYGLHGYIQILQEFTYGRSRYAGIDQYPIELIANVITISTTAAAKTAKFQGHQFLLYRSQR